MPAIDMKGKTFDYLTVLERAGSDDYGQVRWLCVCECGNERIILGGNLRSGAQRSCGCMRYQLVSEANTKHGNHGSREYSSWSAMRNRCLNPRSDAWENYGGRGITICERWNDFGLFYADMGERPENTTLDRIDNDGNYEPGNCRWATWHEQANNKRRR